MTDTEPGRHRAPRPVDAPSPAPLGGERAHRTGPDGPGPEPAEDPTPTVVVDVVEAFGEDAAKAIGVLPPDRADEPDPAPAENDRASASRRTALATLLMATGTIFSRASGMIRSVLLVAALGGLLHADIFTIANTVPNMVYILVAGGIFNAVLVPQLVRAMTHDPDHGEAYLNRIVTLAALFLGGVTVLLVIGAPWLMQIFLGGDFHDPDMAAQRQSVVDFARFCLPQVFFYGMFVLVGQVLNARGSFGPMMWAPIANNVISIGVLVVYLLQFGGYTDDLATAPYTRSQVLLLGLGSTLGIVAQFLILLPYLRRAGVRYRPRFDFRNTGLGHTLRLGVWTVLFVVVNQIAYVVVNRLASAGAAEDGAGMTVYSNTFLVMMVPHAVVTVSLATAILPRLSKYVAEGNLPEVAWTVSSTLRSALVLIIPFACILPVVAADVTGVLWPNGSDGGSNVFTSALALFAPGLVLFTLHYLMLRGFYALEGTRTVFWIQCAVATTNIVAGVVLTSLVDPDHVAAALVVAYGLSYLVGSLVSYALLSRTLGGLHTRTNLSFLARMAAAGVVGAGCAWLLGQALGTADGLLPSLWHGALTGTVGLVLMVLFGLVFRVKELQLVVGKGTRAVRRRLARR